MDFREQKECLEYFQGRPVFGRLLRGFREKYLSYGKFAGTVTLKNLKPSEREDLEGFLPRNYHGKKSASVSAELFERALLESRFGDVSGKDLLELYFREPMEGKKEQRKREEEQWRELLARAEKAADGTAAEWIRELRRADAGSSGAVFLSHLKKRYREAGSDFDEAGRLLNLGIRILEAFPAEREEKGAAYLAVFAAEVTGNPHAFDDGTRDGKFLEMLVKWYAAGRAAETGGKPEEDPSGGESGFPAMRKQRLYLQAGILRDDVSNYAMAAGLRAVGRDGTLHRGMEGFFAEREPVQIPLSVIAGWRSAFCPGNRIYIVENPSVYAVLCGSRKQDRALMCMNGQPRFSSLLILDLLAKSGTEVWYAGDIDPEGLLIAQRLKGSYQGSFHYWHMTAEDYRSCMSGEVISDRRLKMLEKITDEELRETAAAVAENRKSGYQENMAEVYREEGEGV